VTSFAANVTWPTRTTAAASEPSPDIDALAIHDTHVDFVWKTLQRLGVRTPDLEDSAQDVFLVVHRKIETFDSTQPVEGWLYGICRRVAASRRRRAHQRREIVYRTVPDQRDEACDPEQQATHREAQDRLDAILDEIDDDKRVVFVMFEIEGLGCEDISVALSIPVGTVYSRLHIARKALQKAAARIELREQHDRATSTPPPSRR